MIIIITTISIMIINYSMDQPKWQERKFTTYNWLQEDTSLVQRCIQVCKLLLWGPLDPFLKNLGVHSKVLGVQLIYSQQD